MANIEQINEELNRIGGDREVLTVLKVSNTRVDLSPPYTSSSIPKSHIIGDVDKIKKGDEIVVNIFPMTYKGSRFLKKKYYFPSEKNLKRVV